MRLPLTVRIALVITMLLSGSACGGSPGAVPVAAPVHQQGIPRSVTASKQLIYVTDIDDNKATVYDEDGNEVMTNGSFPNLRLPRAIAYDSFTQLLYVANENGTSPNVITAYDKNGDRAPIDFQVPGATGITFDSHNRLFYVMDFDAIFVLNESGTPATGASYRFPNANQPVSIAVDSHNHRLYASNVGPNDEGPYSITAYDEDGNQVLTSGGFPNLSNPTAIVFDAANQRLYVKNAGSSTITVYDEDGHEVMAFACSPSLFVFAGLMAFDPSSRFLYVVTAFGIMVLDENGNQIRTPGGFPGHHMPHDGIAIVPE